MGRNRGMILDPFGWTKLGLTDGSKSIHSNGETLAAKHEAPSTA